MNKLISLVERLRKELVELEATHTDLNDAYRDRLETLLDESYEAIRRSRSLVPQYLELTAKMLIARYFEDEIKEDAILETLDEYWKEMGLKDIQFINTLSWNRK